MVRLIIFAMVFLLSAASVFDNSARAQTNQFDFDLTIDSAMEQEVVGVGKQKLDGVTTIGYSIKQEGTVQTLRFRKIDLDVKLAGKPMMSVLMNKKEFNNRVQNQLIKITDAPEKLKKTLEDTFEMPLFQFERDQDQLLKQGTMVARPGAMELVKNGQIDNAMLFHQPFYKDQSKWTAPVKISLGGGNFASGDLTYEKQEAKGDLVLVKVSGTLIPKGKQNGADIKNGTYKVKGLQSFNTRSSQFESGKFNIQVNFDLYRGGEKGASTTGTMKVTLKKVN